MSLAGFDAGKAVRIIPSVIQNANSCVVLVNVSHASKESRKHRASSEAVNVFSFEACGQLKPHNVSNGAHHDAGRGLWEICSEAPRNRNDSYYFGNNGQLGMSLAMQRKLLLFFPSDVPDVFASACYNIGVLQHRFGTPCNKHFERATH